jgi:ABC-type sulfate transport system permease subunit
LVFLGFGLLFSVSPLVVGCSLIFLYAAVNNDGGAFFALKERDLKTGAKSLPDLPLFTN